MTPHTTRRALLAGLSATTLLAVLPLPALALTTAGARTLIDGLVGEINAVINSGESEQAMFNDFARIFTRYGDVPTIAISTLGPNARGATAAQKSAFIKAFTGYISRKYGKRFREFIGGQIVVQSARQVKSFYEVKGTVKLTGEAPFEVIFLVSDKSGNDRLFDMLIEGISLLKSERTEIGAMLDRRGGNLNGVIQDLAKAG